ncbi:MAG: histidine phosphatase family protein [Hyphomicrobiaceae bacterium]
MLKSGITLYYVRHGETDWNAARRLQGQTDTLLNDIGRAQARRNGEALRDALGDPSRFDFISSPMKRTSETMEIVREAIGLERGGCRFDARLREIHFGHWEGRTWLELPDVDPQEYAARRRDAYRWRPRGGESYADVAERVAEWLATVERDAVVVSHGGVSRVLRGLVLGLTPEEIAELPVPQDRVLLLKDGAASWL